MEGLTLLKCKSEWGKPARHRTILERTAFRCMWQHMPVTLPLERWGQENQGKTQLHSEFKASLCNSVRLCGDSILKDNNKTKGCKCKDGRFVQLVTLEPSRQDEVRKPKQGGPTQLQTNQHPAIQSEIERPCPAPDL